MKGILFGYREYHRMYRACTIVVGTGEWFDRGYTEVKAGGVGPAGHRAGLSVRLRFDALFNI